MSIINLSQELNGKPVISVTNGELIAKVTDVMVDPSVPRVAALITSKGNLLSREIEAIPSDRVQVWGQDAILVRRPDVVVKEEELSGSQEWLCVSEDVKGRDVITVDGTRIGELNDVVLNAEGELIAYDLAQVFTEDPSFTSRRIPTEATHSFGQDVLIEELT